jgi:hypothetical protein
VLSAYETVFYWPHVLPVKHRIEARTLRRICFYGLEVPVGSVTEDMLVKYFLEVAYLKATTTTRLLTVT